jgi:four helix bundle protein
MPVGHRNLVAWQLAMDLAVAAFAVSRGLRAVHHADIASQLLRAAVSVPANIAEGRGPSSNREFAHFLDIAMGSLREVETLVVLSERLGLVKAAACTELLKQADEVGRVLFGLRRAARLAAGRPRRPKLTSDV